MGVAWCAGIIPGWFKVYVKVGTNQPREYKFQTSPSTHSPLALAFATAFTSETDAECLCVSCFVKNIGVLSQLPRHTKYISRGGTNLEVRHPLDCRGEDKDETPGKSGSGGGLQRGGYRCAWCRCIGWPTRCLLGTTVFCDSCSDSKPMTFAREPSALLLSTGSI